ncbi:uncharacterized protein A4U43_C08F13150 [Asparagus officinalis]|nr:uncharacterized protein A4U43_C08F13150 [Asparagus officinalis]
MRKLTSPSKPDPCGAGKRRSESKGRIAPKRNTYFKARRADPVGEIAPRYQQKRSVATKSKKRRRRELTPLRETGDRSLNPNLIEGLFMVYLPGSYDCLAFLTGIPISGSGTKTKRSTIPEPTSR